MKIEQVDKYRANDPCSTFTVHYRVGNPPVDIIYGGTIHGNIFYILLQSMVSVSSTSYTVEVTSHFPTETVNRHRGSVDAILCAFHPKLTLGRCPLGMIITGSRDHTIKIWNANNSMKPLIQTLTHHTGMITSLADGCDGSFISCSSDGTLKVWMVSKQSAATTSLTSEDICFECKYNFSVYSLTSNPILPTTLNQSSYTSQQINKQKDIQWRNILLANTINLGKGNTWLTSLAITTLKIWTCYVSDSIGNIHVFRKNSMNDLDYNKSRNIQQLVHTNKFDRVHELSITYLTLINDDDILVSLSSDGYCKLSDAKTGFCITAIHNHRNARYVGVLYISKENKLYITDELGYLEMFSVSKLAKISTTQMLKQTTSEKSCTLSSHRFQALGLIKRARNDNYFYILYPYSPGNNLNIHHVYNRKYNGIYTGEIALWKLEGDQAVLSFNGHQGSVIGVSAYSSISLNNYFSTTCQLDGNADTNSKEIVQTLTTSRTKSEKFLSIDMKRNDSKILSKSDSRSDSRNSKRYDASLRYDALASARLFTNSSANSSFPNGSMKNGEQSTKRSIFSDTANAVISPTADNQTIPQPKPAKPSQFSEDECSLFTVGSDHVMKSWDQFDCKERFQINFQFLSHQDGEILCAYMIWDLIMPSMVTCYDNGTICVWNVDSGAMVSTNILKESIACVIQGYHNNSNILLVADISGKIAIINVTLFNMNPTHVPVDGVFHGYHNRDDPEILCMSYHRISNILFTGGNDRTIRYRRIVNERDIFTLTQHNDAVCCLETSKDFMLSGDESGEMILWYIDYTDSNASLGEDLNTSHDASHHGLGIRDIKVLCKWPTVKDLSTARALCQMLQIDNNMLYILQAGLIDRIVIWKIHLKYSSKFLRNRLMRNDTDQGDLLTSNKVNYISSNCLNTDDSDQSDDEISLAYNSKPRDIPAITQSETIKSPSLFSPRKFETKIQQSATNDEDGDQEFILNPSESHNFSISIMKYAEIFLDVECLTAQMTYESNSLCDSLDDKHHDIRSIAPRFVYVGTSEGPVLRYDIESHRL